jgi:alpha-beta hydrolase superfamily lysophospholipase
MSTKKILAIHGLGGHSGWFERLRNELINFDIEIIAFDLPGFGKNHIELDANSIYQKGHIESYLEWKDFIRKKYAELKDQYGNVDILGHSLGAVLATSIDFDHSDKLILSVPGYKGAKETFNPFFVGKAFWHYAIDKTLLDKNVFIEMPISEKDFDTPAIRDELRVGTVSQNLLFQILKLGEVAKKKLQRIQNKVLMIQVEKDAVVDNKTQDEYFDLIASNQKNKIVFTDTDHDWIWTDKNPEIAQAIASFINN